MPGKVPAEPIVCPMCNARAGAATIDRLVQSSNVTGMPEAVLRAVWASAGRTVTTLDLFDAMYVDDPDGGPSQARMYEDLHDAINVVNVSLAGKVRIVPKGVGRGRWRLQISC
ncbi:hypothetical protein LY56_02912 [Roseinatronobacter thiooxidans]|uniref:Uncharacterized protein n=1 Tax=Roseinatronobacter thiooxidans TaxID=121821 RepID=A0A2W7QDX0_9RHOB|nr:hypothetical protein LY56_02912 [Roseinatronobacter thiooxidans]